MAVFRFAKGGGTIESNLERWKGQFATRDTIWTETSTLSGFPIHLAWISGTFVDGMTPHGAGTPAARSTGQGLLGALLESPSGLVVFKSVQGLDSARAMLPAFRALLASVGKDPANP